MKKVLGLMILLLSLLAFSNKADAQCNQVTKIYEKYYGIAAGLTNFKSQIDKDNNTYIVGCYRGNGQVLDLGNGMVLPDYGNVNAILLIKFDRNAKPLWYRLYKTNDITSLPSLSIDDSGYVVVTSTIVTSLSIDNINQFFKYMDSYILKFSPAGNALWCKRMTCNGATGDNIVSQSINISPMANLYAAGWFGAKYAYFDNITLKKKSSHTASTNLFLVKYDSYGNVKWALSEGSSDSIKEVQVDFTKICTDEDENVYVAGRYKGLGLDIKLGKFKLQKPADSVVVFIAKYTKNGEAVWAKLIKTNHTDLLKPYEFVYNNNGSLYLSFEYYRESRIDSFRFEGQGLQKAGLIRMDTSGMILKTDYLYSQSSSIHINDLKVDRQGNIYLGGEANVSLYKDDFNFISKDTLNWSFSFTVKTDPDFHTIWTYFQDEFNTYEENNCISIDDSGKVNLIITNPNIASGYDKFYYTQLQNNFVAYPLISGNNYCFYDKNASISLRLLNGKRPYSVQWQGGLGTDTVLSGLNAGIYKATITDANSCVQNVEAKIFSAPDLIISAVIINDNNGQRKGRVKLTVSGGTPPYKFQWNDPFNQTTQNADVLYAGTYTCTITDKNGCVYDSAFTVKNITGIDELLGSKVFIYPNPVSDGQLNIDIQMLPENLNLSLYDGIGRVVLSGKVTSGSNYHEQFNITTRGIHFLKMEMGGKVVVRKVVVE
jgi:hypothetical protein